MAAAETLNFRRAAAQLNMTQPPLSRKIQALESELGVQLFERSHRRVQLTSVGRIFRNDAVRLLHQAEMAAATAQRAGRGEAGRVRIAFTGAAGYQTVPRLLAAAHQRLPEIDVALQELVSVDQLTAFAAGTIDLGFLRPLDSGGQVEFTAVEREMLVVALPAQHRLRRHARIDLASLQNEPFVIQSPREGRYFHDKVASLLDFFAVRPDIVQSIDQTHTVVAMVRAGLGVAIVPASARRFRFDGVIFRPLLQPAPVIEMCMAWRADEGDPAVLAMRALATELFRPAPP